jgi:hypothetical protein
MLKRDDDLQFAMLPDGEGQIPNIPSGPAPEASAPPPAESFDIDKLMKESDSAGNRKLAINLVGGIGDLLSNRQGFGNFYTGKMSPKSDAASRFASAAAESASDPMQEFKKRYEAVQANKQMQAESADRDPNSKSSMALKSLAPRWGIKVTPEMSAYDIKQMIDPKKMMETEAQSRTKFENDLELERVRQQGDLRKYGYEQGAKRAEKSAEKDEKKKAAMFEIEDRRRNINDNLDVLDSMIKDKGTYEALGSHNQDLDRLVEQIATDMAKLQDPGSVARPNEVEAVKKNLIKSGFQNTNATARDILKNFRSEVARRANGAYKVRDLTPPSMVAGDAGSGEKTPQQLAQEELARRAAAKRTAGR